LAVDDDPMILLAPEYLQQLDNEASEGTDRFGNLARVAHQRVSSIGVDQPGRSSADIPAKLASRRPLYQTPINLVVFKAPQ